VLDLLVPAAAAAAEVFADDPDATLFPEEEAVVARAVDKRRREFTMARVCARRALAAIGVAPGPILPGAKGAPAWPAGVIGSMTHTAGYRAAVVARRSELISLGIDAEPNEPLPGQVLGAVSLPDERRWLAELPAGTGGVHWDRLLFCAKEATYKAWFPLAGRWLGFEDALITVTRDGEGGTGTFTSRLLVSGPTVDGTEITAFTGRWLAGNGLVIAAIAVPPVRPGNET
jgi:4'-phosphopantetheinyl transferase EntD